MKTVLVSLMILHTFIHLTGFIKAFQFAEISLLNQHISKPIGILWLLAALLLLVTTTLFLLKKDWWSMLAIISVLISQFLIILYWKDAKFGTIVNIIILLISITSYYNHKFDQMVHEESSELLKNITIDSIFIAQKDISLLPTIVQQWIQHSGVIGQKKIRSVRLNQIGKMRTKPEGKWMPFSAQQYFNTKEAGFVWYAKVKPMPFIFLYGRDKLLHGEGDMLIKLAALFPVVHEHSNDKIDSGSLLRYLAEICWFPSAALNEHITWEAIDKKSAKATLKSYGKTVSGVFTFSPDGNVISFEAQRYYDGSSDAKLEVWVIENTAFKDFNGYRIPYKSNVIWKLKGGDFNWLNLEIIDITYNTEIHFKTQNKSIQ